MSKEKEFRSFGFEVRASEGGKTTLAGYAATFNALSEDMWGFREQIAPGAFKKTLKEQDVCALWQHETGSVMGRVSAGNLTLREDDKGLAFTLEDPLATEQQLEMLRRGFVNKMSFGFVAIRDQWEEDRAADTVTRTLLEVRLYEVSPVTFPAYSDTACSVRAMDKAKEIRSTFQPTKELTMPNLVHIADHRRMSLELAKRQARQ